QGPDRVHFANRLCIGLRLNRSWRRRLCALQVTLSGWLRSGRGLEPPKKTHDGDDGDGEEDYRQEKLLGLSAAPSFSYGRIACTPRSHWEGCAKLTGVPLSILRGHHPRDLDPFEFLVMPSDLLNNLNRVLQGDFEEFTVFVVPELVQACVDF